MAGRGGKRQGSGRKPKPVEVKRAEGNPGKRNLPEPVLVAGRNVPVAPPPHLPDVAKDLWDEVVGALAEAKIIDRVDIPALLQLCVQFARARQAGEILDSPADEEETEKLRKRVGEQRAFVEAAKVQQANRMKAGLEVRASEISALTKAEVALANLETFVELRTRYGNLVALGSTGQVVESPLLDVERQAASLFLRFCEHYALTPVARTRLGIAQLEGRSLQRELADELGGGRR